MSQTPHNEPVLGTIFDGKYRLDALMGKGGMGKVFRVTHMQLNKIFALKLMDSTNIAFDPNRLARFRREAEALARINHPNVVMVTDFGITPDQTPYIVMEYIEGIPLRVLLDSINRLPEKQAILIAKQICAGVHAAHVQGIIHRDLKPENIMVQRLADEVIMTRVVDFGIAKLLEGDASSQNITRNNELLGTLKYITPEQFMGTPVDVRSDTFGISLIIYEMLSGIVPPAIMSMARPLYELCPGTSFRLSEILAKGLAQWPEERYQSALELKRDLENLEHDSVVEAVRSLNAENSGFFPSSARNTNPNNKPSLPTTSSMQNSSSDNLLGLITDTLTSSERSMSANKTSKNTSDSSKKNTGSHYDTSAITSKKSSNKVPYAIGAFIVLLMVAGAAIWQFYPSASKNATTDNKAVAVGANSVSIKGSETIGARLAKDWAQDFMVAFPDTKVLVEAKGTATGIKALLSSECEIAAASRPANKDEKEQAKKLGFELDSADNEHIVAFDAIAIIVNSKNPIEKLTKAQIRDIFSGKISNWSEIGGTSGPIDVFTPAQQHGTYQYFKNTILTAFDTKLNFSGDVKEIQEFSDLNKAVKDDVNAISFITFTNTSSNKVLSVADSDTTTALLPSEDTVRTESYILSRRLFLYTGKTTSEKVKKFIEYVSKPGGDGQKRVVDNGFVKLGLDSLPTKGKREILTVIRFNPKSDKIDNLGLQSIERLQYYCSKENTAEIELLGYTDAKGDSKANLTLAMQRAASVAEIMKKECPNINIKVSAMGDTNPIGDNSTDEGRRLNRRVEVWLTSK